jgi:hypothetical protein
MMAAIKFKMPWPSMQLDKIRPYFIVGVMACVIFLWFVAPANALENEQKRLIKAAYVYNIAKFTRWPDSTPNDLRSTPLSLCIAGEDELGLEGLRGKVVKKQPLEIHFIKSAYVPRNCHMLYVSTSLLASRSINYLELIQSINNFPVLTLSEIPDFARQGGGFELYQSGGQTRFIINLGVIRRAGLEVNPRLLNLAVVIGQE